jgi:hypothetical protein
MHGEAVFRRFLQCGYSASIALACCICSAMRRRPHRILARAAEFTNAILRVQSLTPVTSVRNDARNVKITNVPLNVLHSGDKSRRDHGSGAASSARRSAPLALQDVPRNEETNDVRAMAPVAATNREVSLEQKLRPFHALSRTPITMRPRRHFP